jgi:elongation factor G
MLDGVNMYLPNPKEVTNIALDQDKNEEKVILESDPKKPFVGWRSSWRTGATAS